MFTIRHSSIVRQTSRTSKDAFRRSQWRPPTGHEKPSIFLLGDTLPASALAARARANSHHKETEMGTETTEGLPPSHPDDVSIPVYIAPQDVCVLAKVEKLIEPLRLALRRATGGAGEHAVPLACLLSARIGALDDCLRLPGKREDHIKVGISLRKLQIMWTLGFCRDAAGAPLVSDDGYLMCARGRFMGFGPPGWGRETEEDDRAVKANVRMRWDRIQRERGKADQARVLAGRHIAQGFHHAQDAVVSELRPQAGGFAQAMGQRQLRLAPDQYSDIGEAALKQGTPLAKVVNGRTEGSWGAIGRFIDRHRTIQTRQAHKQAVALTYKQADMDNRLNSLVDFMTKDHGVPDRGETIWTAFARGFNIAERSNAMKQAADAIDNHKISAAHFLSTSEGVRRSAAGMNAPAPVDKSWLHSVIAKFMSNQEKEETASDKDKTAMRKLNDQSKMWAGVEGDVGTILLAAMFMQGIITLQDGKTNSRIRGRCDLPYLVPKSPQIGAPQSAEKIEATIRMLKSAIMAGNMGDTMKHMKSVDTTLPDGKRVNGKDILRQFEVKHKGKIMVTAQNLYAGLRADCGKKYDRSQEGVPDPNLSLEEETLNALLNYHPSGIPNDVPKVKKLCDEEVLRRLDESKTTTLPALGAYAYSKMHRTELVPIGEATDGGGARPVDILRILAGQEMVVMLGRLTDQQRKLRDMRQLNYDMTVELVGEAELLANRLQKSIDSSIYMPSADDVLKVPSLIRWAQAASGRITRTIEGRERDAAKGGVLSHVGWGGPIG
jgi:hypothetical protein